MLKIAELREKRAQAIADARKVHEAAKAENRTMTSDEQVIFDRAVDESDKLKKEIETEERAEKLVKEEEELRASQGRKTGGATTEETEENRYGYFGSKEYREEFKSYLSKGTLRPSAETEKRAIQMGVDVQGGYLVTPVQMVTDLLKAVDDQTFVRTPGHATILPPLTQAASLGVISLDSDPDDGDWTVELGTGSEDTGLKFGKRALFPHPLAKRVKISKTLLRFAPNAEGIYNQRLSYKFGITLEKAYLTGDGQNKPLGIFTPSNDGIPTSCDVATGNAQTALTFDGLINAKMDFKAQYWSRLRWLFHKDAIKMLLKIKDGDGQYIWRQSLLASEPDTLLGVPIDISEYCPHTFTAGKYVGSIQDWSYYWIVDSLGMTMQVLTELYAETNQNGAIARLETDGAPLLSEAFRRVTLAP